MMRIESGPTGERVVRSSLLCLLFVVFAVFFLYDGWRRYASQNLTGYLTTLTAADRQKIDTAGQPAVLPGVTNEALAQIDSNFLRKIAFAEDARAQLAARFGGGPSFENAEAWFYFGPAAAVRFDLENGRPTGQVKLLQNEHSETDLAWQKRIGIVLTVFSLFLIAHAVRVRTTRAVLDDAGLALGSRPPIAWDAMKSLDISRFKAKGWVDLYHTTAGGETRIRLDEYHYKAFDEMMNALCERKGFENPLHLLENPERNPKAAGRSTSDATDSSAS